MKNAGYYSIRAISRIACLQGSMCEFLASKQPVANQKYQEWDAGIAEHRIDHANQVAESYQAEQPSAGEQERAYKFAPGVCPFAGDRELVDYRSAGG